MRTLFRGIGWRVFFSFTMLLVSLMLILSFIALKYVQRSATDNAENELRVSSVLLSEQLQRYLKRIETGAKSLSGSKGFLDVELQRDKVSPLRIENFLDSKMVQLPVFEALSVLNTSGIVVASTDPDWRGLPAQRELFFVNGLKHFSYNEFFVNEETTEKTLLVSTPINEGADPHGVLVGEVKLATLYDILSQQLGLGASSQAFLLDSRLRFITPGKGMPDELLQSHLASTPLMQHLQDEFWVGQYKNYKGAEVLGTVYRPPGNRWYLVIERDFAEVQNQLGKVKHALFSVALGLLFVLIVVTIFLTLSITQPLKLLVEGAQRIAAGDFTQPVTIPKGADEISFLATEFDKMRARVAASQGRLIEQLEESEQKRIESERLAAIGTLASSLAHEIRNPLNAMNLLLSHMERTKADETTKRKMVDDMRTEIGRLDRLVSDILDYARPLQLQKEKLDFREFIENLVGFYKASFETTRVQAKLDFPSEKIFVEGDRDKLRQAFVNLIQNAMEAMPQGGSLEFKVERSNGASEKSAGKHMVMCQIIDSGIGISEGALRRLFDLFFTTKERGTGLGLSNVRKIVDAHGGKIEIESVPQKGTTVSIWLPV